MLNDDMTPPAVPVEPGEDAPVRVLRPDELRQLGQTLDKLFQQYRSDRRVAELKWLRNLRQYLGIYDPDIERELGPTRSKAYPRLTRAKCVSVLSRIMNLMFPGNERNWQISASPSPDMNPQDVMQAIQTAVQKNAEAGIQQPVTDEMVEAAVLQLAEARAAKLSTTIDDQLQELGGDQTLDYVALNRKVAQSGIMYGIGLLEGPYVRVEQATRWQMDPQSGMPAPVTRTIYKPQYDFLPVWDFFPDMSAKTLFSMDGYFVRKVMTRAQLRALAKRPDFFGDLIKKYLSDNSVGNFKPLEFETELRSMGVKVNVNEQKTETSKYEVLVWHGPVSAKQLQQAGVEIDADKLADDIEAEIWMVAGHVIKADINAWRKIGIDMRMIHPFVFDEDDTAVVGNGLPNVMRDSAMSVAAATRMLLDNASVICGPNMELNTDLLRPDQDLTSVTAYKMWYREGLGADANLPAVRNVPIDGHMAELMKSIELFMSFADMETFVGPATGGDMAQAPSEPMRTAAGASMLRSDAALPFKDIVRNFDSFTQSVITSIVAFNKKFNTAQAPEGDYNVVARGATSLIAKEIRGMQVDQLAVSLSPEERDHVDDRKFVEARFNVRDLGNLLVSPDEAVRKQQARQQQMAQQQQLQDKMIEATVRKTLAEAFKNITQGQKNSASADAQTTQAALAILEKGLQDETGNEGQGSGNNG